MTDQKFQFTVRSARHPVDLASGRMVADTDEITLNQEEVSDPYNKNLMEQGILVYSGPVDSPPEATPEAAKAAEDAGIALSDVAGTGKDGRIKVEDVEAHLEAATATTGETKEGSN